MQGRSGARLTQKTHVLCFDDKIVPGLAVDRVRNPQPPREAGEGLLDACQVIARIEVAYVVAFPRVDATTPDFEGGSGHVGGKRCLRRIQVLTSPRKVRPERRLRALARES
jgi:hypothetical protein